LSPPEEEDFKNHIAKTLDTDPEAGWIFIVDQLNIHKSASLVRLVAQRCGIETDLGVKDKCCILESMAICSAFLSNPKHRIRFVYVPKHTSWLNQIECWCEHPDETLAQAFQFQFHSRFKRSHFGIYRIFQPNPG
jgi:hypothetical protein